MIKEETFIDLISRQAALNCFHDWIDKYGNVNEAWDMPEYREIEKLPGVEIIQCKDCEYSEYDHPYVVCGVPVLR